MRVPTSLFQDVQDQRPSGGLWRNRMISCKEEGRKKSYSTRVNLSGGPRKILTMFQIKNNTAYIQTSLHFGLFTVCFII
jgi:hypothetical protein